jgi:hypothetical protein
MSHTAWKNRRIMATALTASLLLSGGVPLLQPAHAEDGPILKGSVIQTKEHSNNPTINPNDIKEVAPGTTLDMVVSTALTPGVNVEGDEFYGKISQDYCVDGKVVIPKGTIVHGIVDKMEGPKRAGRNGYINSRFDYMVTPDGREISIDGGSSTRDSKGKAAAKVVGRAAGYTLGGGLIGAIMVVKYGGLAAIAASNGYALAGGAAVGGAVGLTAAMISKGHSAMIQPGAEIRVKLTDDLRLPTVNMPDASADDYTLEGLKVKVTGMRYARDPFGEPNEITLTLDIDNKTENTFSTFEIGLEDEYGNLFFPSPFGDTGMWFSKITPNSHATNNITFNVDNIKSQHKLVFFKQYSREPLAKFALTESMISEKDKKAARKLTKISKNDD